MRRFMIMLFPVPGQRNRHQQQVIEYWRLEKRINREKLVLTHIV
jgi:hypothetical protein